MGAIIIEEAEMVEVVADNVGSVQLQQMLEGSFIKTNVVNVESSVIGATSARKATKKLRI